MSNEFVAKNGLISLSGIKSVALSGQPNTLLIVDNQGNILNSTTTIDSLSGSSTSMIAGISANLYSLIQNTSAANHSELVAVSGNLYSTIASISSSLDERITTNTNNISYLGSISGDWARKSVANTFTQPNIFTSDVEIGGTLTVAGSATYVNTQTLLVEDNIITLNSGLTGYPPTFLNAGVKVNRGDTPGISGAPYYFMWREVDQTFRIGIDSDSEPSLSGSGDLTQAVATREDNPTPDRGIAVWNNTARRFDVVDASIAISGAAAGTTNTIAKFTGTGTLGNSNITDNGTTITLSGASTFYSTSTSMIPLTIQGLSGQTANLEEWKNSSGTILASISANGAFTSSTLVGTSGNIVTHNASGTLTDSGVGILYEYSSTVPNYNSAGTVGQIFYQSNYVYYCVVSGISGAARWVRWNAADNGF